MNYLRIIAQILLFTITSIVFVFALFSGSEGYGGGFIGIIKNAPNALPWILLFGLNYLAWKKELIGGVVLTLFGIFISWFFNFNGGRFDIIVFSMTSLITILGLVFVSLGINKEKNITNEKK
ncbi:MAG: hypothetical protein H8E84_07950 [Flavobacteriales bacterium]|nr:hypothetical protein [Flavobacteriales bacterium]